MGRGALSYYKPTALSGAFSVKTVHRIEHGVCADVGQNANKFYRAALEESATGTFRCRTHYGRVGYDGKHEQRGGPDRASAEAAFEAVLSEKFGAPLGSGKYDRVEILAADSNAPVAKADSNGRSIVVAQGTRVLTSGGGTQRGGQGVQAPTSWHPDARNLYNRYLREATVLVETGMQASSISAAGFETPLGLVGPEQLTRGLGYLDDLARAIRRGDRFDVDRLNNAYFRTIPTASGMKLNAAVMHSVERVQAAHSMLDDALGLIAAQQQATPTDNGTAPEYPVLLEPVTAEEIAALTDLLRAHPCTCSHHRYQARLTPARAFRVTRPKEREAFRAGLARYGKDTVRQMWHGTRRTSVAGILSRGLLPSSEAAAAGGSVSGAAFGPGIYLAFSSAKSLGYVGGAREGERVLLMTLAALGKAQEHTGRSGYGFSQKSGYHSVWAKGGADLLHDEVILKSRDQAAVGYVVEV